MDSKIVENSTKQILADEDDDEPKLCESTAAILAEFLAAKQKEEEGIDADANPAGVAEDWQLSQFWYSEETADILANEAIRTAGTSGSIACISSPTAFMRLKQLKPSDVNILLLEFDTRFQTIHDDLFLFYDYRNPESIPEHLHNWFDVVICDPPFLSEECMEKSSITTNLLAKRDGKIIVCTGALVEDEVAKFFKALPSSFRPKHKNNLANEFLCFVNYEGSFPLINS